MRFHNSREKAICHGYTHFLTQHKIKKYIKKNLLRLTYLWNCVKLLPQSTKSPTLKEVDKWQNMPNTHCNRGWTHLFQILKQLIIYIPNTLWSCFSNCRPYRIFLTINSSYLVCREQIAWGKNSKLPIFLNKYQKNLNYLSSS